jgi:hypothetical protein
MCPYSPKETSIKERLLPVLASAAIGGTFVLVLLLLNAL